MTDVELVAGLELSKMFEEDRAEILEWISDDEGASKSESYRVLYEFSDIANGGSDISSIFNLLMLGRINIEDVKNSDISLISGEWVVDLYYLYEKAISENNTNKARELLNGYYEFALKKVNMSPFLTAHCLSEMKEELFKISSNKLHR